MRGWRDDICVNSASQTPWQQSEAYSHEELGAVGVLAPVGHGQEEGPVVFENKVLVCSGMGMERKREKLKRVRDEVGRLG